MFAPQLIFQRLFSLFAIQHAIILITARLSQSMRDDDWFHKHQVKSPLIVFYEGDFRGASLNRQMTKISFCRFA
jgi:hypothetical protein